MTVNEYGRALFLLTEELSSTEAAKCDVKAVGAIFNQHPDYVKLLDTPSLAKDEKLALIDGAFATIDESVRNLIKILCERHSVFTFDEVSRTYLSLYNESRGIVEVEAVSAIPMTSDQVARLTEKLAVKTGKHVIVKNTVSPEILGGMKLRYLGLQLDGSVKTRLDKFEKSLKNTVI